MKSTRIVLLLSVLMLILLLATSFTASAADEEITPKMSVTMAERLVFNIYVPKNESIVEIKLDGAVQDLSSLPEKNGYSHLEIPLNSCDADREIKLVLTVDGNGGKKTGTFTFSLVKYAAKLINGNETETVKKLAKDILGYVNSARKYFGKESSDSIEELIGDYDFVFDPVSQENATIGLKLVTFVLESKPAVRFYLADGFNASDFTFTQDNKTLQFATGSDEYGSYMEISRYAYAMTETFNYTVNGAEGVGSYNLSSYCDYVRNTYSEADKDLLLDLAEKFYEYCESAKAYRREVIISMCEHSYSSVVKEKATAMKEGIMEYSCSKCRHSYSERIPTTLKVLAIGNSFSEDAFAHLYMIAKDAGIENVVLGNYYRGGCSLATHLDMMNNDSGAESIFYISSDETGGMIKESEKGTRTAKYAITYADWDYISIQQASKESGLAEQYDALQGVIDFINANKTDDAEIMWHMTWAYQQNSTHTGFPKYNNDQMTMYNAILGVVQDKILTNSDISFVIPSGTAVQNLRTSALGDNITRDGYHLSYGIGRYTAALTWFAKITGSDIDGITATPSKYPEVATYLPHIKDAVKKAIANPYEVTESAYPKTDEPEDNEPLLNTTLSSLSDSDRAYLTANGFDAERYMLLDLDLAYNAFYNSSHSTNYKIQETQSSTSTQYMKWWSTQVFAKDELITGSVIRIDAGTKYRPEGWIDMQKNSKRPDSISVSTDSYVIVDDAWWGSYNYRAFNVGKASGATFTQEEYDALEKDCSTLPFKIYIPIVKRAELTADDRAYLESQGLDPDCYQLLDFEYFVDAHYNSDNKGAVVTNSTGTVKYKYVATEIFSKYDLTVGTVIRLADTDHNYRPEGWQNYSSSREGTRPNQVSLSYAVVDSDWWGDFIYRGFNIQKKNASEENPVTKSDASALRIYVPIYPNGMSADDVAYLESLGLNAKEYRVLNLEISENSYYNSTTGFTIQHDSSTGTNYNKYLATQIFSKDELTLGSVIRINSGYKYRPDAWVDMSTYTPKSNRPATVTQDGVIVDETWWGEFSYRGFNINKTSGATITADEGVNFKIYVKIA